MLSLNSLILATLHLLLLAAASRADRPDATQVLPTTNDGEPSLLDRLGSLLSPLLSSHEPTSRSGQASNSGSGSSSSFLWGQGSLEVVRTQALYATRPAAFGPHITVDEGQRGHLIPISALLI